MPAANATSAASTGKVRPDLKRLDEALKAFFAVCADQGIPVIAHAARSNGRDAAHDDFSSPSAWDKLLCVAALESPSPVISLGHFGGDNPATQWTTDFANLMKVYPKLQLFGDLGYWDHLLCEETTTCNGARTRLKSVLSVPIGDSETVADRVMFASDWLMLSQVPGWKGYTRRIREGVESIANANDVAKIMGGNARRCFARINS
jgi:predicted TIM-barrel fold metal-dependent hydrolase